MIAKGLDIVTYDYQLPKNRIAKHPLPSRDQSKLLVYHANGSLYDGSFVQIPDFLPKGATMVFNNSRVIQARLLFQKETGANIEIFCLEPVFPPEYSQIFTTSEKCVWKCMVGNLKKWKDAVLSKTIQVNGTSILLNARKINADANGVEVEFTWNNQHITFAEIIESTGVLPIPPYLERASEPSDKVRYQTVYAKSKGSVAAPTAGLHFTNSVLDTLSRKSISKIELTLHVGAGTFQPIQHTQVANHKMHAEHIVVYKTDLQLLVQQKPPVIAVGTTSVRMLESLYWLGVQIMERPESDVHNLEVKQWEYDNKNKCPNWKVAYSKLIEYMTLHDLNMLSFPTSIMIVPGYRFKVADVLITNFHLPKSTLLLLIAAFIGSDWKKIYHHALENGYRFLSYGDSSLLFRSSGS